jgi:hypothetical protein
VNNSPVVRRTARRARLLLAPAVLLVSLVLVGCQSSSDGGGTVASTEGQTTTKLTLEGLKKEDWANIITDLDCLPVNRGIEVLGIRYADVRGVGVKDAFVWVVCQHETSAWPHQLEVFDGASDPAAPRRIAVLIPAARTFDKAVLINSLSFAGRTVTVDGASYADNDATCCPSKRVHRVFAWTGNQFHRQSG